MGKFNKVVALPKDEILRCSLYIATIGNPSDE